MMLLGVDCGGTNLKIALVKESGEMVQSALEPINFKRPAGRVVSDIASRIKSFKDRHGAIGARNVGMGIAGDVDSAKGIVRFSPNLGWKNVPLKKLLARDLNASVAIENDANCAAWGAYCLDAKKDCENLICLTLGTGVGGGIIIGRKLYRGSTGSAGEIGHLTVKYDGRLCGCGSYGCLESRVGAWGMIQTAKEGIAQGRSPMLKILLRETGAKLSPRLIEQAARKNDPFSKKIWQDAGVCLGAALASLVNILNPDRIVLCGGVSKAGDLILKPALRTLKERAFAVPVQKVKVTVSKYDEKLGVVGAALLSRE